MTDKPTDRELRCWNCGHSLAEVPRPISRHAQCDECFEALHCCRLCRHYRPEVTGQCDEERADPPVVKENANFCDWFRPASGAYADVRGSRRAAAENRLSALFGDADEDAETDQPDEADRQDPADPAEAARKKLDDLFSKD
jgi:hypothetical protein